MRKSCCALLLTVVCAVVAIAATPEVMNYQGMLRDSGGDPVADGNYPVIFTVWDAESGGTALWAESLNVATEGGLFAVLLGGVHPITPGVFSGPDRYLGTKVDTDPEMPRTQLSSSPYAFHASTADEVNAGVGVTQDINVAANVFMNGFAIIIAEDSILAPSSGYVKAQMTVNWSCLKASGIQAGSSLEIRDSTLTHLPDQEFFWVMPASVTGGIHETTATIHRIFAVDSGWNEYVGLGWDFLDPGHTFSAPRVIMTLTFIPNNYGTINLSPTAQPDITPRTIAPKSGELQRMRERAGASQ